MFICKSHKSIEDRIFQFSYSLLAIGRRRFAQIHSSLTVVLVYTTNVSQALIKFH